jgi:hypothetical protein
MMGLLRTSILLFHSTHLHREEALEAPAKVERGRRRHLPELQPKATTHIRCRVLGAKQATQTGGPRQREHGRCLLHDSDKMPSGQA